MKHRTTTHRSLLATVFTTLALLAAPCVSRAATIDFDDVPDGTVVDTFYPGVVFSAAVIENVNVFAKADALAPSSSNVVSPFSTQSYFRGTDGTIKAQFAASVREVRIDARPIVPAGYEILAPFTGRPYLQAFNAANQVLATIYYAGPLPTIENAIYPVETLTFRSASNNIAYVRFSTEVPATGVPCFAIFDNLRFGNVQTGPTFVVNTNDDHDDGFATDADCTLREAIGAAAGYPSTPTITFAPWVKGEIVLQQQLGQLTIQHNMNISGPGAKVLAVSGNDLSRVFHVAAGTVQISGLKITKGRVIGSTGIAGASPGGVGGAGGLAEGAGIYNQGQLGLVDCWIADNSVVGGTGGVGGPRVVNFAAGVGGSGGGANGAGLYNSNVLSLVGCTVSGNSSIGGSGGTGGLGLSVSFFDGAQGGAGGTANGGGIFHAGISFGVTNCTISGNTATGGTGGQGGEDRGFGGAGGSGTAGGIAGSGLNLTGATITQNAAVPGAGGFREGGGTPGPAGSALGGGVVGSAFPIFNSLLADNRSQVSPDYSGDLSSFGYNLVGIRDQAGGFTNTGDQAGSSGTPLHPVLAPLADYGGQTPTHLPLAGSPAIDTGRRGPFNPTFFTDQRGRPRPFDFLELPGSSSGDQSDIGAVEVDYLAVPIRGLFNTGVDDAGQPRADNAVESHYTLVPFSPVIGAPLVATSTGGFPIPPWNGDSAASAWITPSTNTNTDAAPGTYHYRTSFDLTGLDRMQAQIAGRWASDDLGVDILVNGVSTGFKSGGFGAYTPFRITSGFVVGTNTLTFVVNNGGTAPNPSGLRVELSGVARVAIEQIVYHSPGMAQIVWVSIPGRAYRVQYKVQLSDPVWIDLPPDIVATTSPTIRTDFIGNAPQRFYRVIMLP